MADKVIFAGHAALKGTLDIIKTNREELEKRFNPVFLYNIETIGENIRDSITDDLKNELEADGYLVFKAGKGGVLKALWDMSEEMKTGFSIDQREIPVRQETIEICEFYGIDPYALDSTGCLLIVAKDNDPEMLKKKADSYGIALRSIGTITSDNDKCLLNNGRVRYLDRN